MGGEKAQASERASLFVPCIRASPAVAGVRDALRLQGNWSGASLTSCCGGGSRCSCVSFVPPATILRLSRSSHFGHASAVANVFSESDNLGKNHAEDVFDHDSLDHSGR